MKRTRIAILLGLFLLLPSLAQSQPDRGREQFFDKRGPRFQESDLRITNLEMSPDPARAGQRLGFEATVSNRSSYSERMSLFVKDRDEVVAEARDVLVQPGQNRISFPRGDYRLSRGEHCFTVEVDIERSRRPVDLAREFCASKTPQGWSLSGSRVGPFFVEDLEMLPDVARPGQDVRFKVRLRNDGRPLRANIRIQDRDETVVQLSDVPLSRGQGEYQFPSTRYQFQRFDHCFIVIIDVERTPYRIDAAREFCAKPLGWTVK
jgi:hypothetical protein